MRNQKNTGRSFNGKGYYIALILCAAAIGISGYLYYQNNDPNNASLADPTAGVGDPNGNDIQVVAPDPTKKPSVGILPTQPADGALKTGLPVSGQTIMDYAMDCLSYNPPPVTGVSTTASTSLPKPAHRSAPRRMARCTPSMRMTPWAPPW